MFQLCDFDAEEWKPRISSEKTFEREIYGLAPVARFRETADIGSLIDYATSETHLVFGIWKNEITRFAFSWNDSNAKLRLQRLDQ